MKKYIFLILAAALTLSCKDPIPVPEPEPDPEISVLSFNSIDSEVVAPELAGEKVSATVDWGNGDDAVEWQKGVSVTYSDGAKSHDITIKATDAEGFVFSSLSGISSIDISNFN